MKQEGKDVDSVMVDNIKHSSFDYIFVLRSFRLSRVVAAP